MATILTMKPVRDNAETDPASKGITIYFDPETLEAIDTAANAIERSRSWFIRRAMQEKLGLLPDAPEGGDGHE